MKRAAVLVAGVLLFAACDRKVGGFAHERGASATLLNEEILEILNARAGSEACCFYVGRDEAGQNVYGPLKASRELHFMVRRRASNEDIICGYSGFPPAKAFNGQPMSSGFDTVFVVLGRRLYLREDLRGEGFERMQDRWCGPDWVKPMWIQPVA
ncbi:hypothetical protein [Caulobacter sp. CCUG 60055]|uniref:hypothetical protein n=1 Tax=Caulobacter sp. CCUG 60055 TaxID=2100090 RepID=UPI001FA6D821|nr:hypothetical protein [Caulobacter sp. CCUG 60055]MBQ1543896.1 hypothetical protein [Caulobacteraceae bacterium]